MGQYNQILANGLWNNNPGLIQFLGICPLLAVSNSLVNGLGLGLATLIVLTLSNFIVSLLRPWIPQDIRLPVFILVIALLVTIIDLITQAWFFKLWLNLGIFIPLIVTNCVILARAESFASKQSAIAAVIDGIAHGLGFAAVLILLGGLRELIGSGSLFAGGSILLGNSFTREGLLITPDGQGFLLALLPPGAFLGLGLLIALRNLIDKYNAKRSSKCPQQPEITDI
ncbi:MAG: electron transport complex subunit E [Gammaproteobacteria bacterium]|nr:electron transport complex subunit E [Gammaproteobacteria bacterium]MCP4091052.1 electron transport complex subunit E [Gammaproteobacteria bacterium]MCP4277422.1 electron transport complex subunit E [Gammaproteobacteria bacterium]MCP4831517.1 electron transport complex subunit E [Gammaproteobacteria bacterium]MCP4927740.1 electron transport complex subunit E [Gammaproteobacteria bacterium]